MENNTNSLVSKDEVQKALEEAQIKAKQERRVAIGSLLDKATEVLSSVLETTDASMANARMRAAEVAINLYVQQDNGERQDKALELQQRRLELEEEKLRKPGGILFNQNNLYLQGNVSQQENDTEKRAQELLERKQYTDQLLQSYLPSKAVPIDEDDKT